MAEVTEVQKAPAAPPASLPKKPAQSETPAQAPERIVSVVVVGDLPGYHVGARTHFPARLVDAMVKNKQVKVLGELDAKTHKLLPPANVK